MNERIFQPQLTFRPRYNILRWVMVRKIFDDLNWYCTWRDDPRYSIMLHLITEDPAITEMEYKKEGDSSWETISQEKCLEFLRTNKHIKWFELTNLDPGTRYETRVKDQDRLVKTFKTMPEELTGEIRLLLTSDVTHGNYVRTRDNLGAGGLRNYSPNVAIFAGDIVHDDGFRVVRWVNFWRAWFDRAYTIDGDMIPIVAQLGNHEGGIDSNSYGLWTPCGRMEIIQYFYRFFPHPLVGDNQTYDVIDVGDYLTILSLDSNHVHVAANQVNFIETVLAERENDINRTILPCFHVSPYPTMYGWDSARAPSLREHWTHLFSASSRVKIAHTGHNHTVGVSPKVTGDSLDDNGVVYTGQGASFGTSTRPVNNDTDNWWVDLALGTNKEPEDHRGFCGLTLTPDKLKLERIAVSGKVLHTVEMDR